ncbi:ABC transporter substrate-binding protein [Thermogemmatispora sp.]|uniref:ABC transporter substrate-binding protein n=1 Tax=Thermogemmatispora sp. TaxID=1968838 RepID=UPI001E0B8114|nr:ABC transporter substrate-binding protein [Thermogemmatispora sp.]MBX5450933.1 ABC transporter substrate-binding protein [Thermogemmatispora sp.]
MSVKRQWLRQPITVLILLLAVLASACGSSGGPTVSNGKIQLKIMVGGLSKQIYLPNMLTQRLGYFAQEGLAVTLIDEASGQSAEDEVLAGQVDAGSGSYNHTIELQAAGKQMECVVQLDIAPGEAEIVATREAGQIHSVSDLKGKNLGVTELGSGTQTLTTVLLHKVGIAPNQVHFVPVGAGDTFIAALQQGKIDAGMTTEPTISRILASGIGKVLVDLRTPQTTQAALGGPYPFICVFMRNDYVNAHKDVVQKLVNAYVKTLKWIHSHTAEQIADMMPADYYAGNKQLYVTALRNQLAIFSPDGLMPAGGPEFVLSTEQQSNASVQGKQIDLSATYTNEFASKAS